MKIPIGLFLIVLGFVFGAAYDQSVAVLPLHKELKAERERNTILRDALEHAIPNKFKMRDYEYDAMKRFEARA